MDRVKKIFANPTPYIKKGADVASITVISFILCFVVSRIFNKLFPKQRDSDSKRRVFVEITLQFACLGVIVYVVKEFLKTITLPFGSEGVELPISVFFTIMFFQSKFVERAKSLVQS